MERKTVTDKYTNTISKNERDRFVIDYYSTSLGTEESQSTAAAVHILPCRKPSFAENLDTAVRSFPTITQSDYEPCHACLSVRTEHLGLHWTDIQEI